MAFLFTIIYVSDLAKIKRAHIVTHPVAYHKLSVAAYSASSSLSNQDTGQSRESK